MADQLGQLGHLGLPPDERAVLGRQVVTGGLGGARARELALQARREHLEDPLVVVEAAQPERAQIQQVHPAQDFRDRGEAGRHGERGRLRAEHLPAVRGRGDPGRAVHLGAGVLHPDRRGVPGVQSHPDLRRGVGAWPIKRGEPPLGLHTGRHSGISVVERHKKRVTLRKEFDTAEVTQRST